MELEQRIQRRSAKDIDPRIPYIFAWYNGRLLLSKLEIDMITQELLEILRCPACVREKEGLLKFYKENWFICHDCGRKYPVVDGIPVMLIEQGDKWTLVAEGDLPIPPPAIK